MLPQQGLDLPTHPKGLVLSVVVWDIVSEPETHSFEDLNTPPLRIDVIVV